MEEKSGSINSIEKAFILLDCFAGTNEPLSLKELAERTGWPKSTVHNLLSTMRRQDVIVQNETDGKYSMGIHIFELGNAVAQALDIINIAKPFMKKIADISNKSVHLTALRYPNVVLIGRVEPAKNPLKMIVSLGSAMSLYCNANGKLFLSQMPDHAVEQYIQETEFTPHTPFTITEPEVLKQQIREARKQGYALENNERNMGMHGIAAPILNSQGKIIYSLSVVGIFNEIDRNETSSMIKLVQLAAREISSRLGYKDKAI